MHYPYQLIPKEGTVFHERGEQLWRTAEKYQGTMDFKVNLHHAQPAVGRAAWPSML
jgi:hypothetical protein